MPAPHASVLKKLPQLDTTIHQGRRQALIDMNRAVFRALKHRVSMMEARTATTTTYLRGDGGEPILFFDGRTRGKG